MESIARNQATVADIQRLEDATTNPLTGNPWPAGHDEILQGRRNLPVYGQFEKILNAYHQNQVFILSSETGSGKSTQVPQVLVHDEYASNLRIACTQPRRLAATALAERVAQEMGVVLGEEVGHQIGGDARVDENKKKSRLVYMTEGVLLGKLASDVNLSDFACVIIDEAHERTVENDILMAMLKKIFLRRKDLKVIIMSATMDAGKFQAYFNNCPLVHVTGRNFKVDIRYLEHEKVSSDFTVSAVNTVVTIHQNQGPGNILVFMPGQYEILAVCEMLRKHAQDLEVFPLYGELGAKKQREALATPGPARRCIVSTNIAETSLTIPNIAYVVDSGLSRQMIYNPRLGMDRLRVMPISQASANQRSGRGGRTRPGKCFRLYSQEDYDGMIPSTEPSIRCRPIHAAALRLIRARYMKIVDFDWMDAPHPDTVQRAAQDLQDWGFLRDNGHLNTSGQIAAQCPVDPIWYHAIEEGAKLGCALDIADIAVICSSQRSIFTHRPEHRFVSDKSNTGFAVYPSDHIALVRAFNRYMQIRKAAKEGPKCNIRAWCEAHFLDLQALEDIRKKRQKLGSFLQYTAKLEPTKASCTEKFRIQKALARAFCTQTAIFLDNHDEYRTVHENTSARLAPLSCLTRGTFEWVVYTNLEMSSRKVIMKTATAINAEWLVDLPYFQESRIPTKVDGSFRQPNVKPSLDAAKARIEAAKAA